MDGGPAFPVAYGAGRIEGMTLRDYFAAKAMAAYISLDGTPCDEPDELWDGQTAQRCYAMADAMLKARTA